MKHYGHDFRAGQTVFYSHGYTGSVCDLGRVWEATVYDYKYFALYDRCLLSDGTTELVVHGFSRMYASKTAALTATLVELHERVKAAQDFIRDSALIEKILNNQLKDLEKC